MSLHLALLIAGLLLAGFAATAETSLTSVSRLRMRSLAEDGNRRAARVVQLHNHPNSYLSTILTVNTVALIVASQAALLLAVDSWPDVPQFVVTLALSFIALVFCEIAPKSVALRFNERWALLLGGPVQALTRLLRPVVAVLTLTSQVLVRLATRGAVRGPFVTEEELKMIVAVGEREGVVEQEEREMITGILEMTDKPVRELMVPRVDVVAIDVEHSVEDVVRLIVESGHSRIPLYEDSIDNIVGVIYAKDVLRHHNRTSVTLRSLAREPFFTPEAHKAGELLHEMRERKVHMAIVVDEYGGTAGIITIEDLIEEIVGPIRDEYDLAEQEEIQFLSECEVLMNARVSIDDVRELLHLDIGENVDADTIAGLVYERLGEIPKPGATVSLGDATLIVETVRRQRIQTVRITSPTPFITDRNGGPRDEGVADAARQTEAG